MIQPPFKPIRKKISDPLVPAESIPLVSGGQALAAWIFRPGEDKGGPVLVLVHGWGSNHGTVARLGEPLLKAGYPLLLFDVRHHGNSRGAPYVTARHFRDDISAAVRKAKAIFPGRECVLIGHSMGGSTGVLSVADGAPVGALISIGAPADLWEVWAYHFDRKRLPGKILVKALSPFWRIWAGVPWKVLDSRQRAAELTVPFLVLHGEKDESVPVRQAQMIASAAGVKPHIFPGLGHTDLLESPALHQLVLGFLGSLGS
jgi:pimeloyl-ACP methyl ester carboxylesterase